MVILGIDTAIRCTGYGLVEFREGGIVNVLDCGIIKNRKDVPHSECLRRLSGGIREIAGKFKPDSAAIEGAFMGKNIKTAMILSYARGAVMAVLAEAAIPMYSYSPKKAKLAVCGSGNSTKMQVALMLASLFNLKTEDIPLDSTDALALAVCHGQIVGNTNFLYKLPVRL